MASSRGFAGEISKATQRCLACHRAATPGIVADWEGSLHAGTSPREALAKPRDKSRLSSLQIPQSLSGTVVGCSECHTMNADHHQDTFDHNGFKIHVVISPPDCAVCHLTETDEYSGNIMSRAYGNLNDNPVYHNLVETSIGVQKYENGQLSVEKPDSLTGTDACNYCHGTIVEFEGVEKKQTPFGMMNLAKHSNWPNQGVGRINPDKSMGSCTSCHPRHQFSIEMARKPATCSECHKGPDVPAYPVYLVSKHGNIYSSMNKRWDFKAIPWVVGRDFNAPTCAVCHASEIRTERGEILAERTHQFNDRLPWRIFGLIYAHPHPLDPDTTKIRNKAGLPLPTELTGEPAFSYLITPQEQQKRLAIMKSVCSGCHSQQWIRGHFERFENTIKTTNDSTLTATNIMQDAWSKGLAKGVGQNDSLFNEALEKKWVESWLFYANSIRFSSAMMGADYGVFANGRWYMNKNIAEMADWLKVLK